MKVVQQKRIGWHHGLLVGDAFFCELRLCKTHLTSLNSMNMMLCQLISLNDNLY